MILLHGGLYPEMIGGLIGGFLGSLVLFISLIISGFKSTFYKEQFSNLATSQKVFTAGTFLLGVALLSFFSFYFFMFLFAWVTSLF
jgi:hypothetical protein